MILTPPSVVLGIVLFGEKYLAESLLSIVAQTCPNLTIFLHDQEEGVYSASAFIEQNLPGVLADRRVTLTRGANLFHSGGHNVLIRRAVAAGATYYVAGSNDMLYESNTISELIAPLEAEKARGSAAPRLRQWDYVTAHAGDLPNSKTNVVDSLGLALTRGHHFYDDKQGCVECADYAVSRRIFGPSAALAAYRVAAFSDVGYTNARGEIEYFDELLHYKNDVDLAYRLAWAGWECRYVPTAIAYHDRQLGGERGFFTRMFARFRQPRWLKINSLFGQEAVLTKNFSSDFSFAVRWRTALRRFARRVFATLIEPSTLAAFRQLDSNREELAVKKAASPRRVLPEGIEALMDT